MNDLRLNNKNAGHWLQPNLMDFAIKLLLFGSSLFAMAQQNTGLTVKVIPDRPFVEKGEFNQFLNFDFWIENRTDKRLHLFRLEASAFDSGNHLLFRKFLVEDGDSPGIYTIPKLDLEPKAVLNVFNPFHAVDPILHISAMRYEFTFDVVGTDERISTSTRVEPRDYEGKTSLSLPLEGRFIVYDGHDFYSHHRRVDLSRPETQKMGFTDNPVRYAFDFCVVNDKGEIYHSDQTKKENWYGYGAPLYAPEDGIVVSVENNMKENRIVGKKLIYPEDMPKTILAAEGNHVIIDHGNSEFSELAHMQTGSVTVKKGDHVRRGQLIGRIGFSGDTGHHVHVHYELVSSADISQLKALPSYFVNFGRVKGARIVGVKKGSVETGDILANIEPSNASKRNTN